jgi:hypothetical protein
MREKALMSADPDVQKIRIAEFTARCREAMTPVSSKFSYFPAVPLNEEDVRDYVEEPVAALPPGLTAELPLICIALVPYLEKLNGKERGARAEELVSFEKPAESRQSVVGEAFSESGATLFFAIKDRQVADYHYHFYRAVASMLADRLSEDHLKQFFSLLREELGSHVHGEVDQEGWHLKQTLMRRQTNLRRETKLFREYARQAFVDTLTLYLHGICCDIDVEPGPRQLPSRYLRKRLLLLETLYPPPEGYVVFPEESR